jgi:hypothetical protein
MTEGYAICRGGCACTVRTVSARRNPAWPWTGCACAALRALTTAAGGGEHRCRTFDMSRNRRSCRVGASAAGVAPRWSCGVLPPVIPLRLALLRHAAIVGGVADRVSTTAGASSSVCCGRRGVTVEYGGAILPVEGAVALSSCWRAPPLFIPTQRSPVHESQRLQGLSHGQRYDFIRSCLARGREHW